MGEESSFSHFAAPVPGPKKDCKAKAALLWDQAASVQPDLSWALGLDIKGSCLPFQIEACNREAEKIESLINSDSPTLAAHVPLSALIISQVQISSSLPAASTRASPPCLCLLLLLLSLGLALHLLWTQN